MAYGYGPVAVATFFGFFLGIYLGFYYPRTPGLRIIGYILLFVGIMGMLQNRKFITGIPGGLLTGIGLGITLLSVL